METTAEAAPAAPASALETYYVKDGNLLVGGTPRLPGAAVTVGPGGDLASSAGFEHLLSETPPPIKEPAPAPEPEAVSQSDAWSREAYASLGERVEQLERTVNALTEAARPKKGRPRKTA